MLSTGAGQAKSVARGVGATLRCDQPARAGAARRGVARPQLIGTRPALAAEARIRGLALGARDDVGDPRRARRGRRAARGPGARGAPPPVAGVSEPTHTRAPRSSHTT